MVELRISEAVLKEVPKLERFQSFLRLAVAAGPLLGLIGTVIGMIITFQSITESGSSDPKLMATGISQAMIATVLGLGIAIPLLFANAWLASISKSIVQVLDEQSTGLLAAAPGGEGRMLEMLAIPFAAFNEMRELGGAVVNWIFLACVLLWALVIERTWYFRKVLPGGGSATLEAWHAAHGSSRAGRAHQIRRAMISQLNAGMTANLQVLRVLVPMCPLLGCSARSAACWTCSTRWPLAARPMRARWRAACPRR